MAVRHGYGKVAGADALVFAYDTGDTKNSYKGEPTVNLADTDSKRTLANYGGGTTSYADAPEKGPGWKKVTITAINGSNFRLAKFPYTTQPTNTTRTYSLEVDFNGTSGYFVRGDGFSGLGPNISTSGKHSWTFTTTTNSGVMALFLNNGSTAVTGLNDVIYYRYYQVEDNAHATQFTAGTRSATQGLLDLAGNYTFDLSNVSFTSDAMLDFDGTNDFITLANTDLRPGFTLETVCYPESTTFAVWGQGPTLANRGLHIIATAGGRGFVYGMYGNDCDYQHFPTTNAWHHWVFTYDGTSFQKKFFADGVAQAPSGNTVQNEWIEGSSALRLGTNYGSTTQYSKANGKIAVAKMYNRPLTDAEIVNNFNQYKTRFGI